MQVGEAVVLPKDRRDDERQYVVVACEPCRPPKRGWDVSFRAMNDEERLTFEVMDT